MRKESHKVVNFLLIIHSCINILVFLNLTCPFSFSWGFTSYIDTMPFFRGGILALEIFAKKKKKNPRKQAIPDLKVHRINYHRKRKGNKTTD